MKVGEEPQRPVGLLTQTPRAPTRNRSNPRGGGLVS